MPRYQIHAEFDLVTEVEPELSRYTFDSSDVSEFSDESYFQREEIRSSGGDLRFVVEAESEEAAEEVASGVVAEGNEIEDDTGLTWMTENVTFQVELIEEPMTLDRARQILTALAEGREEEEIADAVTFVFDHIQNLADQLRELDRRVGELSRPTDTQAAS